MSAIGNGATGDRDLTMKRTPRFGEVTPPGQPYSSAAQALRRRGAVMWFIDPKQPRRRKSRHY